MKRKSKRKKLLTPIGLPDFGCFLIPLQNQREIEKHRSLIERKGAFIYQGGVVNVGTDGRVAVTLECVPWPNSWV
jgi:hypothetical protein